MASTPPVGPLVRIFIEPTLIGTLLNWGLFGIIGVQACIYFSREYQDTIWLRSMVFFVLVIDVIQTVFHTHAMWFAMIENWGDPSRLTFLPWSAYPTPIFSSIVSVVVQIFFARRIFSVGKGLFIRSISIFIVLVAVVQGTAGMVVGIQWRTLGVIRVTHLKSLPIVWMVGAAVCDIAIATTMSYILASAKSPFMFAQTRAMVDRLITQVIQSGAITAILATIELILFLVKPDEYMYMAL
ncbi:hypothetical protein H0H93_003327 [Arthromyces matolae]|nr:hypothetical protein H0H93_003327 [Arthromyces matolae]